MAYDVQLADRLRDLLSHQPGVTQKRMFGGLAFMVDGHLAVSASSQGGLLLRVDPAHSDALLAEARATRFVMQGRAMSGWLHIDLDGSVSDDDLSRWVDHGVEYARSLGPPG